MKTPLHTFRLIFISLVLASGVALRAAPASDHTPIHLQADIVYKTTAAGELYLDLFYPATELVGAYPLVVYTHGGGWAAGSKNKAQGRSNIARTVRGLTEAEPASSGNWSWCPQNKMRFAVHSRITQSRDRRKSGGRVYCT
jgi:predicted peptidase